MTKSVLILGSAPSAVAVRSWDMTQFDAVVAINNAWQLHDGWTHHIHPEDFPPERRPTPKAGQQIVTYKEYVPTQNLFGGFVYAGGTMAFTAAYWALGALKPDVLAFMGCDMVYSKTGETHFYGTGTADPLRDDPTLMDLRAKALRLEVMAAQKGAACINLSDRETVLPFVRSPVGDAATATPRAFPAAACEAALKREADVGYFEPSGRYWDDIGRFDRSVLREIDAVWRAVELAARP